MRFFGVLLLTFFLCQGASAKPDAFPLDSAEFQRFEELILNVARYADDENRARITACLTQIHASQKLTSWMIYGLCGYLEAYFLVWLIDHEPDANLENHFVTLMDLGERLVGQLDDREEIGDEIVCLENIRECWSLYDNRAQNIVKRVQQIRQEQEAYTRRGTTGNLPATATAAAAAAAAVAAPTAITPLAVATLEPQSPPVTSPVHKKQRLQGSSPRTQDRANSATRVRSPVPILVAPSAPSSTAPISPIRRMLIAARRAVFGTPSANTSPSGSPRQVRFDIGPAAP